jgi:cell division protein FtsI (penicillin-binding protein 3)
MGYKTFKTTFSSLRPTPQIVEDGALQLCHQRIKFLSACVLIAFTVLVIRLFDVSLSNQEDIKISGPKNSDTQSDFVVQRAGIEDRNGTIMAINLTTASLYANPNRMLEPTVAVQKLCAILDNVKCGEIENKIVSGKTFTWLKRHLAPIEQQKVNDSGIVGVQFVKDEKRVYPHGPLFAHVLGYVDIDGNGLAGVEKFFDAQLKTTNKPIRLSLDVRVQQILRDEILAQASEHSAIGGSGVIMDVQTGEIIAMASLPDFDPNHAARVSESSRFNQVTLGAYEMGSTFKVLTMAMGLEGKHIGVNDVFDTDAVVKIGNKKIQNFRGKGGMMSTPEVLMYSSNIGSAQIGLKVGTQQQRKYLADWGMLAKVDLEIPERAAPLYPSAKLWSQASTITISYGHGIAVTPLHVVRAIAAVVNGGYMVKPTLLKIDNPNDAPKTRVISSNTSETMRKLLRLVAIDGYAKKANVDGYFVGGKTGTAEKVVGNVYSKNANLASFMGAFPMDNPKYAVVVLIDEALPNSINMGFTTGGMIAAPVAGRIIEKIAPILGVAPRSADNSEVAKTLNLKYQPRNPMSFKKQ